MTTTAQPASIDVVDDVVDDVIDDDVIEVADELQDLHRTLLLEGHGSFDADEGRDPVTVFRDHHQGGATGARFTAMLLCTHSRSHRGAGRLIRALADTGLLGDAELDELATTFLDTDQLSVVVPASWAGLRLDLDREAAAGLLAAGSATVDEDGEVDPLLPYPRAIRPPLRRWATERLLRRRRATPAHVLQRARQLDGQQRAAVVSGLLDADDMLTDDEANDAVNAGLRSGRSPVRRRALESMAARGHEAAARQRALADPAATVRDWGRRLPS